jgi:hypothetical protein
MEKCDKDRFDALMKLAEFTCNVREKRRDIEWKVSFGVWAVTAASVAYLKHYSDYAAFLLLVLLVLAHAFLWVRVHFNVGERDAKIMYFYVRHASRIVLPGSYPDPGPQPDIEFDRICGFLAHEPLWFQIAATFLVGFGAIMLSR